MSDSRKGPIDRLSDRLKNSLSCDAPEGDKPDFRELDRGSPVSPFLFRQGATTASATTTTSSSSSSSGSVSGRNAPNPVPNRPVSSHSGGLSGSVGSSPARVSNPVHASSSSGGSHPLMYSGRGSSSSSAVNILPAGNIFPSGKIVTTGMATRPTKTNMMGSGTGNYGYGSIIRGGATRNDPEEFKCMGNEQYKKGNYDEAVNLYSKALAISPHNASYYCNRAAAFMALNRLNASLRDCEEAVRLDPRYVRAHHQLGSLFLSLGQVENARQGFCFPGLQPDPIYMMKLENVEKHIGICNDARRVGDWRSMLREADAAIASGADASSPLCSCRAEAFLKLSQLDYAYSALPNIPHINPAPSSSYTQPRFFGMLSDAYVNLVRSQVELALGRFEDALKTIAKAQQIEPGNIEVSLLFSHVRLVCQARTCGNELYKYQRFAEASASYSEGLRLDPSNAVLYCNRAACWFMLGQWDKSVNDCIQALHIHPNYSKALLRKAVSNTKLELWAEAVRDFEVLRRIYPHDNGIAEALSDAQTALKKSMGEDVCHMKFVSTLEQFRAAILDPGVTVVYFKTTSNVQCWEISAFLDALCGKYRSINFLRVDVEDCPAIANAENISRVPTFKIYKNGIRMKEIICPSPEELESSIRSTA